MTTSKTLPARPSLESIRKQAKKLAREIAAGDPDAVKRAQIQLPDTKLPLSQRDAQLVLAREYGFAGWHELKEEVLKRTGSDLESAALQAERAIHDNDVERLKMLLAQVPALLTWQDGGDGMTLLRAAVESFGDSGDPFREEHFTRAACAEVLIDAHAIVDQDLWKRIVDSRSKGMLRLFERKGLLPKTILTLTALGELEPLRTLLDASSDKLTLNEAFMCACRYGHKEIAAHLLDRCISLDETLGHNIDAWRGRAAFIGYLSEHPRLLEFLKPGAVALSPWEIFAMHEVMQTVEENDEAVFARMLRDRPWLLGSAFVNFQVDLLEKFSFLNREPFITHLLAHEPAVVRERPPSNAITHALEYGNAHLIPLLSRIWAVPDDLPHAAGMGDFARVTRWFDAEGKPALGALAAHFPLSDPRKRGHLHWKDAGAQQILDVSLAWACMNRQLEIAAFLVEHGADVNTNWSTHEPASILHECAVHGNFEAAKFLIDHGIDMTRLDHRWNATAEGWAYHAARDEAMAKFLADAERERDSGDPGEGSTR